MKFHLRLAEEKSGLVKFNRWDTKSSGKFTFLGFDFYWAPTRRNPNYYVVKRKTNKKKYRTSLRKMKDWLKKSRSWPLKMLLSSLRRRLRSPVRENLTQGSARGAPGKPVSLP